MNIKEIMKLSEEERNQLFDEICPPSFGHLPDPTNCDVGVKDCRECWRLYIAKCEESKGE